MQPTGTANLFLQVLLKQIGLSQSLQVEAAR